MLMGRRINDEPIPLKDVQDEERKVVIEGQVIALDVRRVALRPKAPHIRCHRSDRLDLGEGVGERREPEPLQVPLRRGLDSPPRRDAI